MEYRASQLAEVFEGNGADRREERDQKKKHTQKNKSDLEII